MTDTEKLNAIAACTRQAVEFSNRAFGSPEEKQAAFRWFIARKEQLIRRLKEATND